MKVSTKEIAIYGIIAIIVLVLVWTYASVYLNPAYSVSVSLRQLSAQPQYYPYQTSHLVLSINNTGRSAITKMSLVFYVDDVQQTAYSVSLPPGSNYSIPINYTYQFNGTYTFLAVADPGQILDLQNRQAARSAITVNVTQVQTPNIYTSIPNNNTNKTQSFYLYQSGLNATLFLATHYNISYFNEMLGGSSQPVLSVFEDLSPYIGGVDGAFSTYANSSYAYTAWIQGPVTVGSIDQVISSFSVPIVQIKFGGTQLNYGRISNTTSVCIFYQGGWTKLVEYYNASYPPTCYTVIAANYTPTVNNTIVGQLKQDPQLQAYQKEFHYTNSSLIGSALIYEQGNFRTLNVFNNSFGFFGGVIAKHIAPLNLSSYNASCLGVAYAYNGFNMCTTFVPPLSGGFGVSYALLNSSEVTANYTAYLYSLVNNTYALAAHDSAISLLSSLSLNGSSVMWNSPLQNFCEFSNASLGCSIASYVFANQSLTLNVTNKLASQITINKIACYIGSSVINDTVNVTLQPGSSANVTSACVAYIIPGGFSFLTSYDTLLNYTIGGQVKYLTGIANVTSYAT